MKQNKAAMNQQLFNTRITVIKVHEMHNCGVMFKKCRKQLHEEMQELYRLRSDQLLTGSMLKEEQLVNSAKLQTQMLQSGQNDCSLGVEHTKIISKQI